MLYQAVWRGSIGFSPPEICESANVTLVGRNTVNARTSCKVVQLFATFTLKYSGQMVYAP